MSYTSEDGEMHRVEEPTSEEVTAYNRQDKKGAFKKDISYLFSKINWGASALDNQAIRFMNEITKRIDDL